MLNPRALAFWGQLNFQSSLQIEHDAGDCFCSISMREGSGCLAGPETPPRAHFSSQSLIPAVESVTVATCKRSPKVFSGPTASLWSFILMSWEAWMVNLSFKYNLPSVLPTPLHSQDLKQIFLKSPSDVLRQWMDSFLAHIYHIVWHKKSLNVRNFNTLRQTFSIPWKELIRL